MKGWAERGQFRGTLGHGGVDRGQTQSEEASQTLWAVRSYYALEAVKEEEHSENLSIRVERSQRTGLCRGASL